jgi:IclR family transcriptional regulator, acetate operon repressor
VPDRPVYAITSVDNALRLIEVLQQQGTLRVTDAAVEIGVAVSTAHRLLAMLCYRGFAIRGGEHRYLRGPALPACPSGPDRQRDLRLSAQPFLEYLNARVNETVHLVVRRGSYVEFVSGVEGTNPVRAAIRVGAVIPAHRTSAGQALLAELSPAELSELYPAGPPAGLAETMSGFHDLLRGVRLRGYGIVDGLEERGMTALGSAVHSPSGEALGAVCIAIPTQRLPKARRPATAQLLRHLVVRLEESLADTMTPAPALTRIG